MLLQATTDDFDRFGAHVEAEPAPFWRLSISDWRNDYLPMHEACVFKER